MGVGIVRVDGTFGKDPLGLAGQKGKPKGSTDAAGGARASENGQDLVVSSSLQPLISQASEADEVNWQAVQAARAALEAGELDTPEAASRAAKAILDVGLY